MRYDFLFVVLVYRNTRDLKEFFESLSVPSVKVVVVNSFYDDESEAEFRRIAEENHADFLSVPNKGYGAGNNRGIEYALSHYSFRYLVVSNADVCIESMSTEKLDSLPQGIFAPSIRTLTGKQQNPHTPYLCRGLDRLKYRFFCKDNWNGVLAVCAVNKLLRYLFFMTAKFGCRRIYAAHGSFVIISESVTKRLCPFYDESVFLFTEEENLAQKARAEDVSSLFVPEIKVKHKEDGSTSLISDRQREITRQSYMTFWKKWNE